MTTPKKANRQPSDLRPEYDFSALGKPVRGKYYKASLSGSNLVLLDPDVARAFPTPEAVNKALRLLATVADATSRRHRRVRNRAARR